MKDFLAYVAKSIVDHPEAVTVQEREESGSLILELRVEATDMGKVIGKEGRIIKAVRDLVKILAVKENRRVNVVLAE